MKKSMLSQSAGELKKVRVLTLCALFAAMAVALELVASIDIGPYISIGFSGLPNQLVDLLFGPVTGSLFAGALDILKYIPKPTGAFFFGFTFDAMLAAFIYGVAYYKKPVSFWRILIAKGLVALIVNMFFATLWLSMLYGKGFFILFPARALKNVIMWPIESVIFFVLAKGIERTGIFRGMLEEPKKDK